MGTIIISADITSVVFLIILLCGSVFGSKDKNRSTLYFGGCLAAAVLGAVGDAVSYITFEPGQYDAMLVAANMISYIMTAVMFMLFTLYFFSVIETKVDMPQWAIYPVILVSVTDILLAIIGTVNQKMIYMDNGEVMDGEWADYPSMLLFLGILYLYFVLFSYRKAMRADQMLAFGGFLFFPILDSWVTLFIPKMDFTYPVVAVAFLILYVIIQEQTIQEESIKRIIFEEDSFTDPVTGFKNRRAYDEAGKNAKRGRVNGVLYCNVNHLDEIREKDGPEAVDKYVLEFDGLLKDYFPGTDICRISDDTFVAFAYKTNEAVFQKKVASFKEIMEQNDDMASFGYVYSEEALLFDMVRDAELSVL